MYIVPKPGCLLRDPATKQVIPRHGKEVPESSFWMRAVARGDAWRRPEPSPVAEVQEEAPQAPPLPPDRYPDGQE